MSKPLLHFTHGNSYPAGAYGRLLDALRDDFDVRCTDMLGHDARYPVGDNWHTLVDELIAQLEALRDAGDPGRPFARRRGRHAGGLHAGPTWRAAW
jgi:hypothetical protein